MTILCTNQSSELQSYLAKKTLTKFIRSSIKSTSSSSSSLSLTPILMEFATQLLIDPSSSSSSPPLSPTELISPSTSPVPILPASSESIDSLLSSTTSNNNNNNETENLINTLMQTVSMAWQRYITLYPSPPPSLSSSSSSSILDNDFSSSNTTTTNNNNSSNNSIPSSASFGLIISDSDRSIIHVGADFELITGYQSQELIGKNASLLQGRLTSEKAVTVLRAALKEKKPCQVLLINYRKDGQPFWNLLTIAPFISSSTGMVNRWFGIQMIANESWKIDRPMPIFPWTQYPLPNMHTQGLIIGGGNRIGKKKLLTSGGKGKIKTTSNVNNRNNNNNNNEETKVNINHTESINNKQPLTLSRRNSMDDDMNDDLYQDQIDNSSSSSLSSPPLRPYLLSFVAETLLPTRHGRYRVRAYRQLNDNGLPTDIEIMVIIHGQPELIKNNIPLRVHDACFTSEVLHSLKCDCREQLEYAMKYIRDNQDGIIIYLPQEGRGIGLSNKIKAYSMQELGFDTVDANRILGFPDDNRAYNAVPSILNDLGIQSVKLLSNNTRKFGVLRELGVVIKGRIPVLVLPAFTYPTDNNNNDNNTTTTNNNNNNSPSVSLTPQVAAGAPSYVVNDTIYAENYVKAKIARMGHMNHGQDM